MRKILLSAALLVATTMSFAQVGVGTSSPDASAVLDIVSTTKMLAPPRMTEVQMNAISTPAEGGMLYCTDCTPKGFFVYNGIEFVPIVTTPGPVATSALAEVLEDSASTGGASNANSTAVTFSQLTDTGVTGLDSANTAAYQAAIASETGFSNPPTVAEVQAIIDTVNAA